MHFQSVLLLGGLVLVFAKVQFLGINIAGFEFGCSIDGSCPISQAQGPLTSLGGGDGAGQMQHFVTDDQMNIFRLPVSWQFLVNNKLGGRLDATNFGKYDQLLQTCLATGASCVIDFHNFARFNGLIIGQSAGGPTNIQFADIWTQLAAKYKSNTKIIFGLMNEPHDLDVPIWAASCQSVVTAIRNTGASNMILLPGTNFASAGQFVSSGSAAELIKVKNPDGSFDGLVLDLHKYLDEDNSGGHSTCTTDNIVDAFAIAADFLRSNGRKALVSETGAGTDTSCFTDFCAQNIFLNQNSDVFLGYIAWAAGSFPTSYILSLTPTKQNGKYVDTALASQCVIAPWLNAGSATTSGKVSSITAALGVSSSLSTAVAVGSSATPSAGSITTTITLTSTYSKVISTMTRTFSTTLQATLPNNTASASRFLTVGGTASWANGTVRAISATYPGSSGILPTATSTSIQVVTSAGASMKCLAMGLILGSFWFAVLL